MLRKRAVNLVGMRTVKTALAVTVALIIIEQYGISPAKVIFATIGAMSAVAPTFKASLQACLTQIYGVTIGGVLGICMSFLSIKSTVAVGVGVILIISTYQILPTKLLPVLPCLILVNICLTPQVDALNYTLARGWDTAIGLGVGLVINLLICPYDNSRKIRKIMENLDTVLLPFLEDLFDGDCHLPETDLLEKQVDVVEEQLLLFSEQRLLYRRRREGELKKLECCGETARALVVELETLRNMDSLGRLNLRNHTALLAIGVRLPENAYSEGEQAADLVTNYHVEKLTALWEKLRQQLGESGGGGR